MTVWTLTTDAADGAIMTTVHATEADALACLRDGFALGEDVSDENLVQHVANQGVVLYVQEHTLGQLDPNVFTLTLDADTIRDHFAGVGDPDDDSPSTEQRVGTLSDEQLTQAGQVVINRLSESFWTAVDDLFEEAVKVAVLIASKDGNA